MHAKFRRVCFGFGASDDPSGRFETRKFDSKNPSGVRTSKKTFLSIRFRDPSVPPLKM